MKIIQRDEIEKLVHIPSILNCIEEGFILYGRKEAIIPPVGTMHFDCPPGDCHIKYGYAINDSYYVVKIASSFYNNSMMGLPTGNGLMLLFNKNTGKPVSILLDEGFLTDLRTAAAGCVAAKYLAPKNVHCIGIVGTGAQARFQLDFMRYATDCKKVMVWGRDPGKAKKFCEMRFEVPFQMEVAEDIQQLAGSCNLIITTTPSSTPLLFREHIQPGTHITALGSDDSGKQELDSSPFSIADRIVVKRELCLFAFNCFDRYKSSHMKKISYYLYFSCLLLFTFSIHSDVSSSFWVIHWKNAIEFGHKRNDISQSINAYTAAIRALSSDQLPCHLYLLNERGNLYLKMENFKNAIEDFSYVLDQKNANRDEIIDALIGRSRAHFSSGHRQECADDCKRLAELEPFATPVEETEDYIIFKMSNRSCKDAVDRERFIKILQKKQQINSEKDVVFSPSGMALVKKK